jgi:hypothetical protein
VKILLVVNEVSALMKQKMSARTVACNRTYGQIQVQSDHIFHLLANLTYVDLEDPSNPLEYFELFCTPGIAEVITKETNQYAHKVLESATNLKLKSRTHFLGCY